VQIGECVLELSQVEVVDVFMLEQPVLDKLQDRGEGVSPDRDGLVCRAPSLRASQIRLPTWLATSARTLSVTCW
jgi:hypothetical protein